MRRPLRPLRAFVPAVMIALAAACATELVTVPVTMPNARTWVGEPRDRVISVWGTPSESEPDAQGGEILVYRESKSVSTSSPVGDRESNRTADIPQYQTTGAHRVDGEVRAKFWIDAKGAVYRFWFAPEVYKKGDVYPPARPSTAD